MSILGMGPLEIILILLIAFIVLGPERMLDAARLVGKMVSEGRRLASEMPRVVMDDDDIKIVSGDQSVSMTRDEPSRPAPKSTTDDKRAEPELAPEDDGPVAFSPASAQQDAQDAPPERDRTP